jgi:hypothetical protein
MGALNSNVSGSFNTAVGRGAMYNINTGSSNTALGYHALLGFYSSGGGNTAHSNVAIGREAMSNMFSGNENVALGNNALKNSIDQLQSVAIGHNALIGVGSGYHNVALGFNTLNSGGAEFKNTAVGHNALSNISLTGSYNTALGSSALDVTTSGSYNTAIGYGSNVATGSLSNSTAIGARAQVASVNSMVLGSINGINGATADTKVGIGTTAPVSKLNVVGDVGLSDGSTVASNGVVTILLSNGTGATSVAGQIVVVDPANDNSYVTTNAAGNTAVIGVVYETGVAAFQPCRVAVAGVVNVIANGTILRGQHCITSTTLGAAGAVGVPGAGSSIGVWLTAPASGSSGKVLLK